MALLPRLRQLIRRPSSASRVGARRPTSSQRRGDTLHEDALRSMLADDPNNERAFQALAEIVRRRAAESVADQDPLTAPADEQERRHAADLAVWALAEEFAGNPRGWYPLIELARLSVHDDHDGTMRRVVTAAERDPSGRALAQGLALLREAGQPVEALGLGVGHWRPREHDPEVARELVLASIEAGRPLDAKQHLDALSLYPDQAAVQALRAELTQTIAEAEQALPGT
ncbi:MAG: hypothetical protein BGO38_08025 [Cellulomonas sp. 73-145]|uniref:hypothetical protein n=1 Tax=Cellulomonas sp. 73-145 TaxID=1895739 RepID=UPI000929410D|nr:hypothetical protein [Cellulomonas sp. 73-145]OJV58136.1 MAG: hypothetical protein BGO38_08025 [Cellulomonas sp. 73-145]